MEIDFEKMGGLVPAIIQDAVTKNVLMLGFMNKEAYDKTIQTKKVTFWSRSRNCLWTKGETSGNFLNLVSIQIDCDNDTFLVKVHPDGPTCHKGTDTCWAEENTLNPILFLSELQDFIGTDDNLIYESSDLLYHLIVLLTSKGLRIEDVVKELQMRHDPEWDKKRRVAKSKGEMK